MSTFIRFLKFLRRSEALSSPKGIISYNLSNFLSDCLNTSNFCCSFGFALLSDGERDELKLSESLLINLASLTGFGSSLVALYLRLGLA